VEIDLDRHGVYSITGRDPGAVAYELGCLQARHQTVGLFSALAAAAGRLAEALGPADPACSSRALARDPRVAFDLDARRFRFLEHGRRIWRALGPEVRVWVEGFAQGIEDVRRELRARLQSDIVGDGPLLRLLKPGVTPPLVTTLDFRIAAHHELGRIRLENQTPSASNAVAVGRGRARGGGGLLLIDPHIPFLAIPELRMMLVRLRTTGYAAAGMVRLGSPFVFLGFSRHLAWTVTTNWPDTIQRYRVRRQGDSFRCMDSGRRVRCLTREVEVPVGARRAQRFTLLYAGRLDRPVVSTLPGGLRLAVELAVFRAGDLSTQLFTAACTRSVRAFRRRVLAVPGAALTNFVAADRGGGIGCFWHGRVPKAGGGILDPTAEMPADDGGEEGLLVQNNAHFDRVRRAPAARLTDFPGRVANGDVSLSSFRQERTWKRLEACSKIGLKELLSVARDTHDLRGALFVRRMTTAVRAAPALRRWSAGRRRRLSRALGEVARWNRRLDVESRRATLVKIWMELTFRLRPGLESRFNRAETVPDSIPAGMAGAAARALLDAVDCWRSAGRPAWGDVHQLALGRSRYPVGGSSHVNLAAGWLTRPDLDPETLDFPVETGSTCVIAVHLTPARARARFLKVTGPVEDPSSPLHVVNAADWTGGRFQPLDLDRAGSSLYHPSTG